MSTLKIRKVGNSIGVIFPKEIQEALKVTEGDVIDATAIGGNKVVLDAHLPHHSQWEFPNPKMSKEDKEWIDADLEDENAHSRR